MSGSSRCCVPVARSLAELSVAAIVFFAAIAGVATAQGGPGSDAAAERKLTAAYASLLGKLTGSAKSHLASDQTRWLANRDSACVGEPAEVAECLETRNRERTARLEWLADGAYPFISEQAIVKSGTVRGIPYLIDASYPQFDGTTADFGATNRQLAAATTEAAQRVVPGPDADNGGGNYNGPAWVYEQAYTLHRPGPSAISIHVRYDSYEGGTQGMVGVYGVLVDLRSGAAVGPEAVFLPGSNWLRDLTRIVSADVSTPNLADLLKEPRRYVFLEERLELSFNQHEGGPFTVEIPYDRLRPLLRVNGPVPR
jgi:hypothetical protein